jgi:hypothetical protein
MRAMAPTSPDLPSVPRRRKGPIHRIHLLRPWVQLAMLILLVGPGILYWALSKWSTAPAPLAWLREKMHQVPGCVFHCYACPWASFACPIGLIASFAAEPWRIFPLMTVGVIVLAGGLAGSLVCGWACPFGYLQDLAARVPTRKVRLPNWMGAGRFVVLGLFVILLPLLLGKKDNPVFICSICPAGALEASVPFIAARAAEGKWVWMSWYKTMILAAFLASMLFIYRPWCKLLCPLGGLLSLFNRVSLLRLRFVSDSCTECNICRSKCSMGVDVETAVNTTDCIRCMECTSCGAIEPVLGRIVHTEKRTENPTE